MLRDKVKDTKMKNKLAGIYTSRCLMISKVDDSALTVNSGLIRMLLDYFMRSVK